MIMLKFQSFLFSLYLILDDFNFVQLFDDVAVQVFHLMLVVCESFSEVLLINVEFIVREKHPGAQ